MIRPSCKHKGNQSIALYFPMVQEYCQLSMDSETQLKEAVRGIGGSVNVSGLFMSTTSTDSIVSKANGVNRRSVMFIPHNKLDSDLLKEFEIGELP